ncbi:MAG: hypothetical protein LBS60_04060 [Deltaproteobacteria bacterium]|nr:hypothetical protein [Deltaproteobacteria bacterium]
MALVILANYGRPSSDNVLIPFGSGRGSVWAPPFIAGSRESPRAVVGLTDISARVALKGLLGRQCLSFKGLGPCLRKWRPTLKGAFSTDRLGGVWPLLKFSSRITF